MKHSAFAVLVVGAFFVGRASTDSVATLEASPVDCPTKLAIAEGNLGICEAAIAVIDTAAGQVQSVRPVPAVFEPMALAQPAPREVAVQAAVSPGRISPGAFRVSYARIGKLVNQLSFHDPINGAALSRVFKRVSLMDALTHTSIREDSYRTLTRLGIAASAHLNRARTVSATTR